MSRLPCTRVCGLFYLIYVYGILAISCLPKFLLWSSVLMIVVVSLLVFGICWHKAGKKGCVLEICGVAFGEDLTNQVIMIEACNCCSSLLEAIVTGNKSSSSYTDSCHSAIWHAGSRQNVGQAELDSGMCCADLSQREGWLTDWLLLMMSMSQGCTNTSTLRTWSPITTLNLWMPLNPTFPLSTIIFYPAIDGSSSKATPRTPEKADCPCKWNGLKLMVSPGLKPKES